MAQPRCMSVPRYATQNDMFKAADAVAHTIYVSSDKHESGKGSKKWFTHFATYEDLSRYITGLPAEQRTFYEIIREHRPANLYLDIEFLGPAEPAHGSIAALLEALDERIRAMPCRDDALGCEWIDHGATPPPDMLVLKNSELERHLACSRTLGNDIIRAIPNLALRPRHTIYTSGRYLQVCLCIPCRGRR